MSIPVETSWRHLHRRWLGAAAVAVAALTFAGPVLADESQESPPRLRIQVEDDDGSRVDVDLGAGWLAALVDAADFECEADGDRQALAMMESLDAQGEGGVHRYLDDDGDRVIARRSRGALKLESTGRDGEISVVEMPWDVARCLILGVEPPGDLGRRIASGDAKLRVDVRDRGGRVRLSLD